MPDAASTCVNCGRPEKEHVPVNWSDGNLISGHVLLCPTTIYQPAKPPSAEKA